ncbi:beta-lactamase family protein [Maribacter algarum]|uniref:Beta-lactamase family protein n=1 Tax=Maribacter algarum (ex Zhang et al. 2020) TaxID=2578118 RepID=A0A5S3PTS2_9FLAO|nr:serine hydrolase domain-containing protein [Maribacter algarum]TMM58318.1 beta-lactamase family protein [Maribacter algarum]
MLKTSFSILSNAFGFIILAIFLTSVAKAQTVEDTISVKMTRAFQKSRLPGLSLAMVNANGFLYQNSFGYADLDSKKLYDNNTIQNIGSISKTLIGVSLMQLVEKGKLRLEDPINKYLPFSVDHPKFPQTPITILHLATHSSGLKDTPGNYEFKSYYLDPVFQKEPVYAKGFSLEEKVFLKKIKDNKRISLDAYLKKLLEVNGEWYNSKNYYDFKPGSFYEYTNIGASLAAYIVELVAEMPYEEFTKKEIFKPLKMDSTGWFYKDVDMSRFATRYVGKKHTIAPFYELSTYPDGGLKTTSTDLGLFLQEMLKGYAGDSEFLSKESFETLFKNHLSVPDGERNGIFWDVFAETGVGDIGHSGIDPGVYNFMYFNPSTGIGKILMTNATGDKNQENTIAVWEEFIHLETLFLN